MKTKISLVFIFLSLFPCLAQNRVSVSENRAEIILRQLCDTSSNKVFVVAHRADWRNYPENTVPAIESAIEIGVDMVELDVRMTRDSVLVLMHDKTLGRMTDGRGAVSSYNFAQLQELKIKDKRHPECDSLKIPSLREALLCCKDRVLVNLDRALKYYPQVIELARELDMEEQIIVKGSESIEKLRRIEDLYENESLYMPVLFIRKNEENELFEQYIVSGESPFAFEVCWGKYSDNLLGVFERAKQAGSRIWVNTLWPSLCGGRKGDDRTAQRRNNPHAVYQRYIDMGVTIIQTDNPQMLLDYLREKKYHE